MAGKQTCQTVRVKPLATSINVPIAAVELGANPCSSATFSQQQY
jgi:hypothetical protein